jgi:hypothetical protein
MMISDGQFGEASTVTLQSVNEMANVAVSISNQKLKCRCVNGESVRYQRDHGNPDLINRQRKKAESSTICLGKCLR